MDPEQIRNEQVTFREPWVESVAPQAAIPPTGSRQSLESVAATPLGLKDILPDFPG
jgi:hypothetical protein